MDSNISAVSCIVCRPQSVLDFCAIWFQLMSGVLPESQSQSMLGHRVLHVHPEDVKGDVSFSLTDRLSADCCLFLGSAYPVGIQCPSHFSVNSKKACTTVSMLCFVGTFLCDRDICVHFADARYPKAYGGF